MSGTPRRVAIVGAGMFGVTAAIELRRRGSDVVLLDAGPVPHPEASSTDLSKAVRMDYGTDDFYLELAAEALEGWRRQDRERGTTLFHASGILMLTPEEMQPGGFEYESLQRIRGLGIEAERLDRRALAERFPAWSQAPYSDGYFNPEAGWVESGKVVARLAQEARSAGVEIRTGSRCASLLERGSRVAGVVLDDGSTVESDTVLVAAGAWTPILLPQVSGLLSAVGQPVIHFDPPDPEPFRGERFPVWCADISRTGWYGFPLSAEGSLKVGHHGPGFPYRQGQTLVPGAATVERFAAFITRTFPQLAGAPVLRTRICLYCDSRDGNFLIDHDPQRPGLVVAAGGSGHGFKFAPLLGGIIADVVQGKPNRRYARFAWRAPSERAGEQARFDG